MLNAKLPNLSPRIPRSHRIILAIGAFVTLITVLLFQFSTTHVNSHANGESQTHHRALRNLAATTTTPQPLRLHFTMKRSTMNVLGLSEFDVLANPVVSADMSVTYNAVATFQVGDVTHKYMIVDGVTYYVTESAQAGTATETPTCMVADALPQILAALNGAKRVNSVQSSQSIDCPSNKLYKLSYGGDTFVLCSTLGSASGFKIYGADLTVEARFVSTAAAITAPTLSAEETAVCGKLSGSTALTTSTMNLLSGTSASSAVNIAAESTDSAAILADATCTCKGAMRPCIFFHGLGHATEGPLEDTSTYFGIAKANAPCCSSIKYASLNTVNQGWNNTALQQKVCDLSLSVSSTSNKATKSIEDTIIVAHSMGNNMLAGAIATGKCSLSKTSDWVAISGPMRGSMGPDYLLKNCGTFGLGGLITSIVGKCPADTATRALVYEAGSYVPAVLQAQYDAAQVAYKQYVTAAMCSNGYTGLSSSDQSNYRLAATLMGHKSSENDGVVEYQSCAADIPRTQFANTYTSKFYVTKLNHMDTTFRHGDSASDNAMKPVKWFECLL
ncbi:hypothetical protein FI667_g4533, partial [Globisporangium splendens]